MRSLMTGNGFEGGAYGSEWMTAWLVIGVLGICVFLGKKVLKDNYDYPFNVLGASIGVVIALLLITFTTWTKLAFVLGLIILFIGAFFFDNFFGGGY